MAANTTKTEFWSGMGGSTVLRGSGTISGLASESYVDVTIAHDEFVQYGDLSVTVTADHITAEVIAHYRALEFTVRFSNNSAPMYSPLSFDYTWKRQGRLLHYGRQG
jgi:hypothetical protein